MKNTGGRKGQHKARLMKEARNCMVMGEGGKGREIQLITGQERDGDRKEGKGQGKGQRGQGRGRQEWKQWERDAKGRERMGKYRN